MRKGIRPWFGDARGARPRARGWGPARTNKGFTYIELVIASAVLAILVAAIVPVAQVGVKRNKEIELRRDLRVMRDAIDGYKRAVDQGLIGGTDVQLGSEGYPPDLETLVEGVNQVGGVDKKLKFLRRVPIDPMTGTTEWAMRSYQDRPDSTSWGGQNVYDVYTKSTGTALDGTKYSEW